MVEAAVVSRTSDGASLDMYEWQVCLSYAKQLAARPVRQPRVTASFPKLAFKRNGRYGQSPYRY